MEVTRDEVSTYLSEVKKSVRDGRYQISPRTKNQSLYIDYVFSEERCKEILLGLEVDDFSDAVQNDHPQHPEEILYIFGKEVSLLPKQGGSEETVALYIKFNMLTNLYVIVILLLTAPFVRNQSVSVVRKLSVCMPTPFPKSA